MVKHLSLCLLLASTAALSLFSADPAPKGVDIPKKQVVTVEYDVKDLAAGKAMWRGMGGEKGLTVDGIDGIIRLIVKEVEPKEWRGERFSIIEVNGTSLEIRTTKANHAEIAALLAALRRLADVQVVVEAGLYAVDQAFYEKEIAPRFAKNNSRPLSLGVEEEAKLRKASRIEKPNKVKMSDGGRRQVFSIRRAVVYERPGKTNEIAIVGVRLELEARVSADRRFVIMNLTQQSARLRKLRNMKTNIKGEDVPLDVPDVQKSATSATHSITVGDSVVVVVPPAVPLPGFTAKGRVPLLFVRPIIWIGEEEAEKKKQGIKD
jgi:hypothetical protein